MALRPVDEYTNVAPGDANYPDGSAINATTPTSLDGSPLDKDWLNDLWGLLQGLLKRSSITASGSPDTVLVSDYMDALRGIFNERIAHTTGGSANVITLTTIGGNDPSNYVLGELILFKANFTNTGTVTVDQNSIGPANLTKPGNLPLAYGDLIEDEYYLIRYEVSPVRFELAVNPARTQIKEGSITNIVDTNTIDFVFDFEPKLIKLNWHGVAAHISTLELGMSTGTGVMTITAADTLSIASKYTSGFYDDSFSHSLYEAENTIDAIYVRGGSNSSGNSSFYIGTATYVSSTHTLTITFDETRTNTISSELGIIATATR